VAAPRRYRNRFGAGQRHQSGAQPGKDGPRDVNAALYWDAGHCQDLDPQGFIAWIGKITGYKI
jgi:hypothetical protein